MGEEWDVLVVHLFNTKVSVDLVLPLSSSILTLALSVSVHHTLRKGQGDTLYMAGGGGQFLYGALLTKYRWRCVQIL